MPLLVWLAAILGPARVQGREGEAEGPRICVIAPLGIVVGTNSNIRIRGLKLAGATGVLVKASAQNVPAAITEKKTVDVPGGSEAKDVGDSLAVVELVVPSGLSGNELMISVISPEGTTPPRAIRVLDGDLCVDEKEPNEGFRESQVLSLGKTIRGAIGKERDVDVFAITGLAGKILVVDILAARAGSLLDGALTLYDEKGGVLAANDDSGISRDPQLRYKLPANGIYYLALQDASDRGTPWHTYELSAKEEP